MALEGIARWTEHRLADYCSYQCYLYMDMVGYLFEKNDMMLPCPGLPPPFLAAGLLLPVVEVLAFFGAGSSSEKDSQAASSRVTVMCLLVI